MQMDIVHIYLASPLPFRPHSSSRIPESCILHTLSLASQIRSLLLGFPPHVSFAIQNAHGNRISIDVSNNNYPLIKHLSPKILKSIYCLQ